MVFLFPFRSRPSPRWPRHSSGLPTPEFSGESRMHGKQYPCAKLLLVFRPQEMQEFPQKGKANGLTHQGVQVNFLVSQAEVVVDGVPEGDLHFRLCPDRFKGVLLGCLLGLPLLDFRQPAPSREGRAAHENHMIAGAPGTGSSPEKVGATVSVQVAHIAHPKRISAYAVHAAGPRLPVFLESNQGNRISPSMRRTVGENRATDGFQPGKLRAAIPEFQTSSASGSPPLWEVHCQPVGRSVIAKIEVGVSENRLVRNAELHTESEKAPIRALGADSRQSEDVWKRVTGPANRRRSNPRFQCGQEVFRETGCFCWSPLSEDPRKI